MNLSDRVSQIVPSATSEINAKVAELRSTGIGVVSLSVGEPDFNTPRKIIDACTEAMLQGHTKYTHGNGVLPLREAICSKLKRDNGVEYSPNEIVVSTGAKQCIYNAMLVLVNPGDEVIIPTPCWVSYVEIVKLAGGKPVLVKTNEDEQFQLNIKAIEAALTGKTKAVLINSPNNPTGAVYKEEYIRQLAELAIKKDFYIISDEVYEKLIYSGTRHFCVASSSEDAKRRSVVVNGFSKAFAMTGWRIGYSAAPLEITRAISSLQSHMTSNSTSFVQYAAIVALNECDREVEEMRLEFSKRRSFMLSRLLEINGIACKDAEGAFYFMPNVSYFYGKSIGDRVINNSIDLCKYLLDEAHVALVPGSAFYAPENVRISYSNSLENLATGATKIKEALSLLK